MKNIFFRTARAARFFMPAPIRYDGTPIPRGKVEELFAYLQSVCGNTTVMQKISAGALEKYGFEKNK